MRVQPLAAHIAEYACVNRFEVTGRVARRLSILHWFGALGLDGRLGGAYVGLLFFRRPERVFCLRTGGRSGGGVRAGGVSALSAAGGRVKRGDRLRRAILASPFLMRSVLRKRQN
jgi:hypothetical protein